MRDALPTPSPLLALPALALLLAGVAPIAAQTVDGVVLEDQTDAGLDGVEVRLLDMRDRPLDAIVSADGGAFVLTAPEGGIYFVDATRLGYARVRSDTLRLLGGQRISLEIRMAVEAVPLEPVLVTGRTTYASQEMADFYRRMEVGRKSGFGQFISRSEVQRMNPSEPTDLLRTMAGVRVHPGRGGYGAALRMAGGCIPAIYIDGMWINRSGRDSLDDLVAAFSIEGVEVYRGPSQIGRFHDPRGCGLILVWTRRGEDMGEGGFSWTKLFVGAGLIGLLLLFN